MTDAINDPATISLMGVIRRSIAALRLAVEDMRIEPTKTNVGRAVEESDHLSASISALSRIIDISALTDPPKQFVRMKENRPLEYALRIIAAVENGICAQCRGAYRSKKKDK